MVFHRADCLGTAERLLPFLVNRPESSMLFVSSKAISSSLSSNELLDQSTSRTLYSASDPSKGLLGIA